MTVEIIDLESSASSCANLGDFPKSRYTSIGGLDFNDNPMLCAGMEFLDAKGDCFTWKDSSWQAYSSLVVGRGYSAWCPSPFPKESHRLIVAGGSNKTSIFSATFELQFYDENNKLLKNNYWHMGTKIVLKYAVVLVPFGGCQWTVLSPFEP